MASLLLCAAIHCASQRPPQTSHLDNFERADPETEGLSSAALIKLTQWLRQNPVPVYSLLISRHGKLVYEFYTPGVDPDAAHYMMSVTKSVVSALVGIAIDRELLQGPDASVAESLPRELFASDADRERFKAVTIRRVLGMAALDSPDPPRVNTPEAIARHRQFLAAPNRLVVALAQPTLNEAFQYNDVTPVLATGLLQYAAGKSALEFAEEALFRPMGFRNYEWMHQDPSGIDNGGYGLRLRPIDMQRFGVLFLQRGAWNGQQLVSREWVDLAFTPWNRSQPELPLPDYGWYWWTSRYGPGWTAHVANGWKGQRIAVIPEQDMVVTLTACIQDGSEQELFTALLTKAIIPATRRGGGPADPARAAQLAEELRLARSGAPRFGPATEARMVPSVALKAGHRPFRP